MRRMLLLIATCALAALALAPVAWAQQGESPTCEDFASQAEAQAALREDPSDPHGLDGPPGPVGTGQPGVACEGAIGGPTDFTPVANEGVVPGSETHGTPASASPSATSLPAEQPTPSPAEQPPATVAVSEDGQVTIDGDVGTDCESFAISVEEGYTLGLTSGQRQDVLAECERLGFLAPEEASNASASASALPVPISEGPRPLEDELDCSQLGIEVGHDNIQEEAQSVLDEDPTDPNSLDIDGDGIACESVEESTGQFTFEDGTGSIADAAASTASPSASATPEPSTPEPEVAAAPGGVLPETGGPALLSLPVAVLLVGAGILGVTVSRRRRG